MNLTRKAKMFHKNIPINFFESLNYDQLLTWLHPIDRKQEDYNSVMKSKHENIFFNPNKPTEKVSEY